MPLTLITGPANAAKAGEVFDRYRRLLDREPVLVVPTTADAAHYGRELAAAGVVIGAEVVTFKGLVRAIAQAADVPGRPLGDVARDRVIRSAIAGTRLDALSASATSAGFPAAAGDLFAELQQARVTPQRFIAALRAWRTDAYVQELGALYSAYRRRLGAIGAHDVDGFTWAALDALRLEPARWRRRPVLWYGFDDLTSGQRDAVDTLADRAEADVVVALPWEAGRAALAGCAGVVEDLRATAIEHIELPARSEHYARESAAALHHLERGLLVDRSDRADPGDAIRILEAGGERPEAELVAATVVELIARGTAPDDIAVVARRATTLPLLEQVLADYGVPVAHRRRVPLTQTRLGAGMAGAVRAAGGDATAADLVTWLRTPGKLADPDAADRLEAAALRAEASTPAAALRAWRRARPQDTSLAGAAEAGLAALAAAAADGGAALLEALTAEAESVWTAPHVRQAAVLDPEDAVDARAAGELGAALTELRGLAASDPRLAGTAADVLDVLRTVRVREGEGGAGVLLADPLAVRARRFRAVVVCGLQDGEFPQRPAPDAFLTDDDRRGLAAAADLRLPVHEDVLARERSLFYACISRAEAFLALSFSSSTEEGEPVRPSPFLEDVRELFTDSLWSERRRRLLADVTWPPAAAPTPHELRRSFAAARDEGDPGQLTPPSDPAVLASIAERELLNARELETYAGCGVRWLIEHVLRPGAAEPDPEYLRRGTLEHDLMETTLRGLRERTGSARLTPDTIDAALAELDAAVATARPVLPGARGRALLRGAQVELARVLRTEAETGPGLEPEHFEWSFGGTDDTFPALDLGTARVRGRVDRIDVDGTRAVVRDYKRRAGSALGAARLAADRKVQAALYALAVRELLGLEPVGAVYQPLSGSDLRPRGLVREGALDAALVSNDVLPAPEYEALLENLREVASAAAAELRAGRVVACPSRCRPNGTCSYPGICRAGEGGGDEE